MRVSVHWKSNDFIITCAIVKQSLDCYRAVFWRRISPSGRLPRAVFSKIPTGAVMGGSLCHVCPCRYNFFVPWRLGDPSAHRIVKFPMNVGKHYNLKKKAICLKLLLFLLFSIVRCKWSVGLFYNSDDGLQDEFNLNGSKKSFSQKDFNQLTVCSK